MVLPSSNAFISLVLDGLQFQKHDVFICISQWLQMQLMLFSIHLMMSEFAYCE